MIDASFMRHVPLLGLILFISSVLIMDKIWPKNSEFKEKPDIYLGVEETTI